MSPKVGDFCRVKNYNQFDLSNPSGVITYIDKECIRVCVGYKYYIKFVKEDIGNDYEDHMVQGGPSIRTVNKNLRLIDLVTISFNPLFEQHLGMGFRKHYVRPNKVGAYPKKLPVEFLPMIKEVNYWEVDYVEK